MSASLGITPFFPRPPDDDITNAMNAIADLLAEIPDFEVSLQALILDVRDRGYPEPAVEWAAFALVQQQKLTPRVVGNVDPEGHRTMRWVGIVVRATAALWDAWRGKALAPDQGKKASRDMARGDGKRRGRPPVGTPEDDERTYNDWKASGLTQKEFARARGKTAAKVEGACKRHRTRRSRAEQKGRRPPTD